MRHNRIGCDISGHISEMSIMRTIGCHIPLALALVAGSVLAFGQTPEKHATHHPGQQAADAIPAPDTSETPSEMMRCHQLTETRMDMIAQMLQEMLEHEKAER